MSHRSIHEDDHDNLSTSNSLKVIDIDTVAHTTDERDVLLDTGRESAQYGSTASSTNGGRSCFLVLVSSNQASCLPFQIADHIFCWLLIVIFSFFRRPKPFYITVNGREKGKVLHSILKVDTRLFLFTVCSP